MYTTGYTHSERASEFESNILSKNENLTLRIFATKCSILDIRQCFFFVFFALRPQNIRIFVEI